LVASVAFGGVIVTPTISFGGGLYTYDYLVSNTGVDPAAAVISFQLTISGSFSEILTPLNWFSASFPAGGGETGIQWIDPNLAGILPGEALSGFGLTSSDAPGLATFQVVYDDLGTPPPGSTQGPSAVPEPSGGTLAGLGLLGLLSARFFLRRRGEA
jgi:hypothetical protein